MGFVLYDVETTGLNPAFDQIVQFAAIRTDNQLRPLDRFEIKIRLMDHILPCPDALCVTGTGIDELLSPARPSFFEAMCLVYRTLLSWSPATFIGYNSIRFDEAFLRHAFYQTLHPAYLTSRHNNGRGDVLRLARAVAALRPEKLLPGINESGAVSLRLGDLCTANGYALTNSHDAMADVESLLWLCDLLANGAPDIWSQFARFTNKAAARDFLTSEDAFVLVDPRGADPGMRFLAYLGDSKKDANLPFCVDLTCDLTLLRQLDHDALVQHLTSRGTPIRRVRINAGPLMIPIFEVEGLQGAPSEAACLEQAALLRSDPDFLEKLLTAARATEVAYPSSPYVESQLYERFVDEEGRMEAFHQASWEARPALIREFQDARLFQLGRRILFAERPDLLEETARQKLAAAVKERLSVPKNVEVPWMTIAAARAALANRPMDERYQASILDPYMAYLDRL